MKRNILHFIIFSWILVFTALPAFGQSSQAAHEQFILKLVEADMASKKIRVYKIKKILDGVWNHSVIEIGMEESATAVNVTAQDVYSPPPKPSNPEAIHMVLAFQLTSGKTRADFAKFKALDGPWLASNNGSNAATIWTNRSGDWIFDAFEDVVFASKADFNKAYAGNEELGKAAEGLFGDQVLVAIVEEQ
jgi:hypothetical protein|tara:strand:+ start:535 stop:1107 length:573 start_codon:yes stop_codon:yes gene_type:complete